MKRPRVPPPTELVRRVTALEELLTYQEQTIDSLNEVVIELRGSLEEMREKLTRLEANAKTGEDPSDPNERPPHY